MTSENSLTTPTKKRWVEDFTTPTKKGEVYRCIFC
jgi:hypothetical protein